MPMANSVNSTSKCLGCTVNVEAYQCELEYCHLTHFIMAYKCNFCGKADICTQVGLKVHIQLSKAGCRKAMERQVNRSLSPENDDVAIISVRAAGQDNSRNSDDIPIDDILLFVPSPRNIDSPKPEPSELTRAAEAEDKHDCHRYARDFPTPTKEFGEAKTVFEEIFEEQRAMGELPCTPFADKDEWELAQWLAKNVNQQATEEFLKLPGVCSQVIVGRSRQNH
jgi:hypothetical protein